MMNPWNDMIPLLPLQEFMPLTSVQGKLCASASIVSASVSSSPVLRYPDPNFASAS
ncbi:hypothetical protein BHM03_00040042 [Ensete ventricosum]|nr:hypothetical protein BHM03_00040042 [Ensete ventricosum]